MVLGLKAKHRRGPSVQVEYLIHVQDIKPWPPTQSLKSVRSVLIQWENGDRVSGSTSSVVPSINDGKIEFNESFRLNAVLSRDMSVKNGDAAVFHKNLLEFNLYEPRRDQTVKGQLLGTAIVDLADYGVVKDIISVGVPINCTRSFRNTAQPMLNLKIQPYDKARSNSSLRGKLEKEASLEKSAGDSVSTLMSDEYADEAEVASVSDDDVSSHSSLTALSAVESCGGSPAVSTENGTSSGKCHTAGTENRGSVSKLGEKSDMRSLSNTPLSNTSDLESESNSPIILVPGAEPLKSCQALENASEIREEVVILKGTGQPKTKLEDNVSILQTKVIPVHVSQKLNSENDAQPEAASVNENESQASRGDSTEIAATANTDHMVTRSGDKHEHNRHDSHAVDDKNLFIGDESSYRSLMDSGQKQVLYGIDSPLSRDRLRHVKSVRSPMDSSRSNGGSSGSTGKQDSKVYPTDKRNTSITIAQELEQRIEMLEEELREAAALEIALYSVVAEHVSSMNRIHAPARRLSRLYLQASKEMRASAAHSAVSGLVVVAKACGNDVPRLTFWLSNCIVLRAIICGTFVEEQFSASAGPSVGKDGVRKGMNKESLVLKWNVSSYDKKGNKNALILEDWGNPHAFMSALEKVESWIFSRVVESVWWQTLTPHMQSSAAKVIGEVVDSGSKSFYRRTSSSGNHEQVNFSLELWKKAFKDACERLCPVRAGGHECGCLPVLAKLIMEQCVARLDVAMFNAILRESADDIPTDPVSDPISDAKVLPIPAGRSSFGAGAQLKNAIGNWSRILTDLFGMDDDDAPDDEREDSDETHKHDSSVKSFHLLKSLSDLMMLPKDMLLSESIRREVCPALSTQVIKRALDNFVPDEFCLDPIPGAVIESLNSENDVEDEEGLMTKFPLTAPAVFYSAPSASSLASLQDGTMGTGSQFQLRRSGSVLKRSNTSDDELDELDSPLNSILRDSVDVSPKEIKPNLKVVQNHGKKTIRYQLLRQMWGDGML